MVDVSEIVRSRVRVGREEDMLKLRPAMIAAVRARFPELIEAKLIRLDNGLWLDVIQWGSREAAEQAAAQFDQIPESRAMSELIEEIVSFEHGTDAEPRAAAV
jgi:hypothetical protein